MKKKIAGLIICIMLMIIPAISVVSGTSNAYETKIDPTVPPQMKTIIQGLFPRVSTNDIAYLSFPEFQWVTIQGDSFDGHIGILFRICSKYGYIGRTATES